MPSTIKAILYQHCVDYIQKRLHSIQETLDSSQESANSETKSTAGDKHDTARAMMQLDVEQNRKHLVETQKLNVGLSQIKLELTHSTVQLGALVFTNSGIYYIAISIGKVNVEDKTYFVISPSSPIGQAMFGLKKGDSIEFNGRNISIDEVR